jgi:hypothetical protein
MEKKDKSKALGNSYQSYHLDKYGKLKDPLTKEQQRKRKASKAARKARKLQRA